MRNTAIVTGASSGIGLAVSRMLCRLDYEVFGIGRTFPPDAWADSRFHPTVCDVLQTKELLDTVKQIAAKHRVCILVNNAGVAYYGLHEELNPAKIQQMVRTNLEVPLLLSQQLLRDLKKNRGYIINLSSVTALGSSPHGCAYGATKAGLAGFSRSLFDEARKYGVKVVAIYPDMTDTNLYRNADFTVGEEAEARLLPEDVANALEYILRLRDGLVVSDLTLKPQLHRIRRKNRPPQQQREPKSE